jgi:hypothetical protein
MQQPEKRVMCMVPDRVRVALCGACYADCVLALRVVASPGAACCVDAATAQHVSSAAAVMLGVTDIAAQID